MLHITTGESVRIEETGLPGEVVRWLDVLHEGPTPAALTLEEMSDVRARFIASAGWSTYEEAREALRCRDRALVDYAAHEEVVLWFEHDMFDQLQLVQILDWFSLRDLSRTKLSLISIGEYPGIGRFKGFAQLTVPRLASLFSSRRAVTIAELRAAAEAWMAFTSANPSDIEALLRRGTGPLPYLKSTLARHLQQFPSVRNGVSRSEQQILEVLSAGIRSFQDAFLAEQAKEERVFLGDNVFRFYLHRMRDVKVPLLEIAADEIRLTSAGYEVALGREDAIRLNGIDRWLGGVELRGAESPWRWDEQDKKLVRTDSDAHRN